MFNTNTLRKAIKAGDAKQLKEMLHEHPDAVSFSLPRGFTPLHLAVKGGNKAIVEATAFATPQGPAEPAAPAVASGPEPAPVPPLPPV